MLLGGGGAIRSLLVVGILLLGMTLSGCERQTPTPRQRALETVARYDHLLAAGFRGAAMDRLIQVADDLQAEDEYIHMSAVGEGGVRMLPLLRQFEYTSVSIEATSALIETREVWDYVQQDITTQQEISVQPGVLYELAWDLEIDDDGSWRVMDVRAITATSTTAPDSAGSELVHP